MPNDLNTNLALLLNGMAAMPSGSVPVRLSTQASAAGVSNVSTTETDLITYTMPANALNANNQGVRITAWGTLAATANTKTVRLYFGSVMGSVATGASSASWRVQAEVIRTSATAEVYNVVLFGGALTNMGNTTATLSETLTAAVIIKVTGQSNVASSDVTALGMIVEWLP